MLLLRCALLLFVALGLGACSTIRVAADWDREINFAVYDSYRWAPNDSEARKRENSLLDKRIRTAVDRELVSKGLTLEDKRPDLLVVYQAKVRNHTDVYRSGWGRWGHGRTSAHQYREGSITVILVDTQLDQVVWQGAAAGILQDADTADEQIREAVRKILEKFPPA